MTIITAREANVGFSKLLAMVEAGEEVVVTRHGKPVVRMTPIEATSDNARAQAVSEMRAAMESANLSLGGQRFEREAMHER